MIRRFTSFRTIELYFDYYDGNSSLLRLLQYVKTTLESALGYAEDCDAKNSEWATRAGLRFYPIDIRISEKNEMMAIGRIFLDGIRIME